MDSGMLIADIEYAVSGAVDVEGVDILDNMLVVRCYDGQVYTVVVEQIEVADVHSN